MPTMNIEPGKFYKTREGSKAMVYTIHDDKHDFPIHGAILGSNGRWTIEAWTRKGAGRFTYATKFDIVSPWIDPPVVDWDKFPKHIVAVAMDEDGCWFGYTTSNIEKSHTKWLLNGGTEYHRTISISYEDYPTFTGDWLDSLAIRPGYEQ